MGEEPAESDPVLRASVVFEAWRDRAANGTAEAFEELVARHEDLRASLQRLLRLDAMLRASSTVPRIEHRSPAGREKIIGDYKILRELGRGAMGIVFEAEQLSLHRLVALKVLPAQLTLSKRALERFQREAEITARLDHRNIVGIHQVSEVDGVHFIAMELVQGTSLDRVIERMRRESFESVRRHRIGDVAAALAHADKESEVAAGAAAPSEGRRGSSSNSTRNYIETAVRLICQVADALDHAHAAGVIHRDIKPSNILVRTDGTPVLTDFGLAREEGLPSVSLTGDFAGTPNYVSPEQAMSGRMPIDLRADVFSLGATLYELLTLELAFPGDSIQEVLSRIITKPPRDPSKLNPGLAPDLITIVLKSLEKDPDRRYASAAELAADLRAFIDYRPIRARRTPTVVRAWRWVKREPIRAAFYTLLAVGIPSVAALGRGFWSLSSTLQARSADLLEGDVKKAFLTLGLGHHAEAEEAFARLADSHPASIEVVVGQALALLNQKEPQAAMERLQEFESANGQSGITRRLRLDASKALGRDSESEAGLGEPETPLEQYVEALRLLRGTSYEPSERDTQVRRREDASKAVGLLQRAVFSSPERATFHFALAWAAWVAGDEHAARLVQEAIANRWPGEAMAWFFVGVAREVYDAAGALEALETASRLDPTLTAAVERRGIVRAKLGDVEGGLEELGRVQSAEPDRPATLVNRALLLIEQGDWAGARAAASEATELDPGLAAAWTLLGEACLRAGQAEQAREALGRALEVEPREARIHCNLAQALRIAGRIDEAREHLERAVDLDPEEPLYAGNLGLLLLEMRDLEPAKQSLQAAIAAFEKRPSPDLPIDQVWGALGYCLEGEERTDEALAAYLRALELAPDSLQHAHNLGSYSFSHARYSALVGPLDAFVRRGHADSVVHAYLVESLQALNRWPEADAAARRWTDADQSSARAWNDLAWGLVAPEGDPGLRDPEQALSLIDRALALEDAPGYRDTRAQALFWLGRHDEAIEEENRAIEAARRLGDDVLITGLEEQMRSLEERIDALEGDR